MDILRFINSKDIREYLKETKYEFNSLEAAWLVYQCGTATLEEKHKAWQEIIETMPDCEIKHGQINIDSLHSFLKEYMELEDKYLNEFYQELQSETFVGKRPLVYSFEYKYKDGTSHTYPTVFSTFDAIYETIMEPDKDVTQILCTKMQVDDLRVKARAYINPRLDIMRIDPIISDEHEQRIYDYVFDFLWFEFPTPFKKGDIVRVTSVRGYGEPFLLTGSFNEEVNERVIQYHRENGDTTDMSMGGIFPEEDGSVYRECFFNYMDLEYYNEELTGTERTLLPISNYLKGKIDFVLCLKAYHRIITEGYADNSMPLDYLEDWLALAGLMQEKPSNRDK